MIREKILNDFIKWDIKKQREELDKLKKVKDYIPLTEGDFELLEMIIENKMVNVKIECDDEKCYIVSNKNNKLKEGIDDDPFVAPENTDDGTTENDNEMNDDDLENSNSDAEMSNTENDDVFDNNPIETDDENNQTDVLDTNTDTTQSANIDDAIMQNIDKEIEQSKEEIVKTDNQDEDNQDKTPTDISKQLEGLNSVIENLTKSNTEIIKSILENNTENMKTYVQTMNDNFDMMKVQLDDIQNTLNELKEFQKKVLETLKAHIDDEKNYGFEPVSDNIDDKKEVDSGENVENIEATDTPPKLELEKEI